MQDDKVITKITAPPIPAAVSTFFETPRNGQIPKNLEKIKLFTKIAPRNNINKLIICPPPMRSSYSLIN